jgi:photosystem II stability/assembly factor-like uncharacterized protein
VAPGTSPGSGNYSLNGIAYIDVASGTAEAVGTRGTILQTTDGGSVWAPLSSPTTENLTGIAFTNSSLYALYANGFAVGAGGTILTSSGNGTTSRTWSQVPDAATSNDLTAVAVGGYCGGGFGFCLLAVGASGTVINGTSGTWTSVTSGTTESLNGIAFPSIGADIAYFAAVGDGDTTLYQNS